MPRVGDRNLTIYIFLFFPVGQVMRNATNVSFMSLFFEYSPDRSWIISYGQLLGGKFH